MDNPKGVAAQRLQSQIGVSHKTAWYMLHRLRQVAAAMNDTTFDDGYPVEVDETFVGGKLGRMHADRRKKLREEVGGGWRANKQVVIGFRHRKTGQVAFLDVNDTTFDSLNQAVQQKVAFPSPLFTDGEPSYRKMGLRQFWVEHGKGEYVRGIVHTNGIESVWGILKRSYMGVYHYMSAKHLWRYLAELECRFNMRELGNGGKLDKVLAGSVGVRLQWEWLVA